MKRLLLALLFCAACNPMPQPPPAPRASVIVLGQLIDRTGSIATPSWGESIRLAVVHANHALKQAGKPVRFEIAEVNSGNSPDMARAGALQLVKQQNAKAIITDSSQDDIAVGMLNYDGDPGHQLDVPIVCMACTSPAIDNPETRDDDPVKQAALRNGKGWNFRTTMSDAYQARMLVQMLVAAGKKGDVNGDGKFKLSIYASDDPYGHGFSDAIRAGASKARPGALVEQIFHDVRANPTEYDWAADVARVTDRRNESTRKVDGTPDAVIEITFPKFSAGFTKAYLASGSHVRLVHTHNFRAARILEALKSSVEGQEGTSQVVLGEGVSAQLFSEELKSVTGQAPAFRDAAAYDAALTVMLASIQAAEQRHFKDPGLVSGAEIRDAMRAINDPRGEPVSAGTAGFLRAMQLLAAGKPVDYQGASGPCNFDEHGDVVAQLARFQVQDGHFVDVDRFDCVKDPACPQVQRRAEGR
ncbi:MAG TPA: ABC transporter substrate-binding protein [Myxococcales bacterium]|nr:ABC transporter substrate-binding protein [Myxococcales bacterium]